MPKPTSPGAGRPIRGTAGDDLIYGTNAGEVIYGLDGYDEIYSQGGDDTVIGGAGVDRIYGGDGNDILDGGRGEFEGPFGYDTLWGGAGNDIVRNAFFAHADGGFDSIDDVFHVVLYGVGSEGVVVTPDGTNQYLATSDGQNVASIFDYFGRAVPSIIGTSAGDSFTLLAGTRVQGLAGDDLFTLPGTDQAMGDDSLRVVEGGDGSDTIQLGVASTVRVDTSGTQLWNANGVLYATADSVENVIGSAGDDTITSAWGPMAASGGAGNDTLNGADGADLLSGDGGDDTIYGKGHKDTMTGGTGADLFLFTSTLDSYLNVPDVITDFTPGDGDVIDVSAIGTFEFVGSTYDTNQGAQATLTHCGGNTMLSLYFAGDANADMNILLIGSYTSPSGISGVVDLT